MSIKIKTTLATLGVAAMLLPSLATAGGGQKLSRADFDRCNQQAMQVAGIETDSPAASPQLGTGATGTGATQPSTGAGAERPAGAQTGAQTGTGSQVGTQTGSGTQPGTGAGPQTGVSGAMGADAKIEQAVQAYRSCLEQQKQN
jgi:hypothetical protein